MPLYYISFPGSKTITYKNKPVKSEMGPVGGLDMQPLWVKVYLESCWLSLDSLWLLCNSVLASEVSADVMFHWAGCGMMSWQLQQNCSLSVEFHTIRKHAASFVTIPVVLQSGIHIVSPGRSGSRAFSLWWQLKLLFCLLFISLSFSLKVFWLSSFGWSALGITAGNCCFQLASHKKLGRTASIP